METTRQNKIARLIQKELSDIFLLQTKAMHGVLVSVSVVRISPDMSYARVYLSVFPSERSGEIVLNWEIGYVISCVLFRNLNSLSTIRWIMLLISMSCLRNKLSCSPQAASFYFFLL